MLDQEHIYKWQDIGPQSLYLKTPDLSKSSTFMFLAVMA